ncbi:MAG: hypothetical protein ACOYOJ_04470 [Alsobacter sp.]
MLDRHLKRPERNHRHAKPPNHPWTSTPGEFCTLVEIEIARWGAMIRRADIRIE